ncbi:ExeM/NucH family extracellular endonuclease [Glaciibacter psychrotolerans]|uniref:5'-nucleotidase n=1 Tax=Glaciibacter psychrotolerans TaxID=670054 RepID=A0A7Z0EGW4_9MICO|nr:ExeM/NucH family extracellular endonuclease [Leifsonia psychrotolerans]NYJ21447.1 5'-nucleotidase [Leifsonia psychrotolerans]
MSLNPRRHLTVACSALLGLGLVLAPIVALPAQAHVAGTGIIINEAYVNGGSASATFINKFVELYNPTGADVALTGMSLQYRAAAGAGDPSSVLPLTGTIPAGGHYLIQGGSNGAVGAPLTRPDATLAGMNAAAGGGTFFLANQTAKLTTPPTGSVLGNPAIIDVLGFGNSLTFETAVAPLASVSLSLNRTAGADTDSNVVDFATAAPTPTNSLGEVSAPPVPVVPDPVTAPADTTPIAQIQGISTASPLVGRVVKTVGVVTANYPTGGFKGFYLQTPGTGGALDLAAHTASDAVFVYTADRTASVAIGDYVEVAGYVDEFYGLTQVSVPSLDNITKLDSTGVVAPTPSVVTISTSAVERESLEGMLIAPQGPFTVTNNYSTNQYGDIGLAIGDTPLVNPTVLHRPGSAGQIAAIADNAARLITLDDGATTNFLAAANTGKPVPYLSTTAPVRVGAAVTFTKPVILDYRNGGWTLQPTTELVPGNAATVQPVSFENTRTPAPRDVGGDIRLATFNVLNYFATTGDSIPKCQYYNDRDGNKITVSSGCDARGAATEASFKRQQAKSVAAINALGADIVSLEEIENSAKFGKNRDYALGTLVDALNEAVGGSVWDYVPSPAALPTAEDVIRTAFIYKKASVQTVGDSTILTDDSAFDNARRPLAQSFQLVGDPASAFLVIVNHFKSKGSGTGTEADLGDGQGASNPSRKRQATALVGFASAMKTAAKTDKVFLVGDFNAYDQEDPIEIIKAAGYISQEYKSGEYTYAYDGSVGSLDHVFASPAADATVADDAVDVWNINSVENVALEYSRFNSNVTNFYEANPYRASDHDPVVLGLDIATKPTSGVDINILNLNDFHGRIDENTVKFAGTVESLRAQYGDDSTLFLSAGDNVGASLFASASQQDKPTIDVLNALGMKASAVGNHEFDQGWNDLKTRIKAAASFDYLGANVYTKGTTVAAMQEFEIFEIDGVKVGVIGAVTADTPSLVTPTGVAELSFGDPVEAVNRVAQQLTDGNLANGEADVLIAEYHEGDGIGDTSTLENEIADGTSVFARIVTMTDPAVNAIFTGHTHKKYAWQAQVPGAADGVTRPVLQTGQYGENVGQVVLRYDTTTKATSTVKVQNVTRLASPVTTAPSGSTPAEIKAASDATVAASKALDASLVETYPRVAEVKRITDAALAEAAVVGNQVIGSVTADISRACTGGTSPCAEDRSAPSAMGTLVANSLRASLSDPSKGGAEIGMVNPGGMRTELLYKSDGTVTYAAANAVLPFVNNLWTTTLTGAQFKTVLEQQWQRDAKGNVPSRAYLQLGLSDNVNYTFDASRTEGDRITSIWINGAPIDPTRDYRIGSFNFLLTGGDNFWEFNNGKNTRDSGLVDRDAWISYITAQSPLKPSFAARQATVTGVPTAGVNRGDSVTLTVSNVNLTSLGAPKNTEFTLLWSGSTASLGTATIDASGMSTVTFTVPNDAKANSVLELTAKETGTIVRVALTVNATTPVDPTAPTTAPTPADEAALLAALEDLITTDAASYAAGSPIVITVGAEHAGEFVSVWVHSIPVNLGGWLKVGATGTVTATLPADLPAGTHRIVVQDVDGNVIGWTSVEVRAAATDPGTNPGTDPGANPGTGTTDPGSTGSTPSATGTGDLAHTGAEIMPLIAGGMLMLLLGGIFLIRRRRAGLEES